MPPVPLPFPCVLLRHGRVPDERHVLGVPLLGGAGIVVAARDNRDKINDNELVVHDGVHVVVAHVHTRLSQPAALVAPAVPAPSVQHHPHIHAPGVGGDEGVGNGRAGEGVGRHTDGGPSGVEGLNEEGIAGSPGREADGHGRGTEVDSGRGVSSPVQTGTRTSSARASRVGTAMRGRMAGRLSLIIYIVNSEREDEKKR